MLKKRVGEGKSVGEWLREEIRKGLAKDFNEQWKPVVKGGVDTKGLSKGPERRGQDEDVKDKSTYPRSSKDYNPEEIGKTITNKAKAIMPVHLMGKPAKMDEIRQIAKKYNLYVIADAAEAHSAIYKGKNVGTLADLSAYSLYLAHIISTIEGGIIVTNSSDFAEILRSLRAHGRACKCKACLLNTQSGYCPKRFQYGQDIRFIFERIGYSCKMNELEAAVGIGI